MGRRSRRGACCLWRTTAARPPTPGGLCPHTANAPPHPVPIHSQVFGRASKYSLFDPCKEMLFITMTDKRVRARRAEPYPARRQAVSACQGGRTCRAEGRCRAV